MNKKLIVFLVIFIAVGIILVDKFIAIVNMYPAVKISD